LSLSLARLEAREVQLVSGARIIDGKEDFCVRLMGEADRLEVRATFSESASGAIRIDGAVVQRFSRADRWVVRRNLSLKRGPHVISLESVGEAVCTELKFVANWPFSPPEVFEGTCEGMLQSDDETGVDLMSRLERLERRVQVLEQGLQSLEGGTGTAPDSQEVTPTRERVEQLNRVIDLFQKTIENIVGDVTQIKREIEDMKSTK